MHTYNLDDSGDCWYVYFDGKRVGPAFEFEWNAAAFASFMNGGRFCPDEIAPLFAVPDVPDEEDEPEDHTTPPSKSRFADYPVEGTQRHK